MVSNTSIKGARAAIAGVVVLCALGAGAARAGSVPEDWGKDWCRESWNDGRAHACEVRELPSAKTPAVLRVDPGDNGGVEVAAGDRAGIVGRARVETWADTEAEARALLAQVRIVPTADGFEAAGPRTDTGVKHGKGHHSPSWNVQFRIEAPAAQALDLETINGPLAVYGMSGRTVLHTENGPVAVERCGGDMLVRTENGPMSVTLAGVAWNGRGLDARAMNGPVTLSVPKGFNADLEFGTINGPWSGMRTAAAEQQGGYAHARLGKGGKPIAVTTENGPFEIETGLR
jgi:hypothetical protein